MGIRAATMLATALLLGACGSSPLVPDGSELYQGRHAAAVAPVQDRRSGGANRSHPDAAETQRAIRETLERSGLFEGVVTLGHPNEGNEAEVIVEAALLGGGGDPAVQVRVTEKSSSRTILDEVFRDTRGDGMMAALDTLETRLQERYGHRKSIY